MRDDLQPAAAVPYVVAAAVSELIAAVAAHDEPGPVDDSGPGLDTVIELEMNGYRCVVTRLGSPEPAVLLPGDDAGGSLSLDPPTQFVGECGS